MTFKRLAQNLAIESEVSLKQGANSNIFITLGLLNFSINFNLSFKDYDS